MAGWRIWIEDGLLYTRLGLIGSVLVLALTACNSERTLGLDTDARFQPSATGEDTYAVIDLGTLDPVCAAPQYCYSWPGGINEAGSAVGWSKGASVSVEAFLWAGGKTTGLGAWGGGSSQATDINEHGQVVGSAMTVGSSFHAVLWDNGVFTELPTLGGQFSEALAINNAGVAVGFSTDISGTYRGVIWQRGDVMPIAGLEIATDINGSGHVVGQTPSGRPALWKNGSLVQLTNAPGQAFGINDAGQIVGAYVAPSGEQHAFLWTAGTLTDLGVANETSEARAINNRGQVVGWVDAGGVTQPVLWDADTRIELPNPGGSYGMAVDISNSGTILGSGSFTWGGTHALIWAQSSRSRD
ncbi:MAG: hypothetical protein P8125_12995 [Gemmatimonadota bacterium]|jgi:probable HAF family extracellular repeat protein